MLGGHHIICHRDTRIRTLVIIGFYCNIRRTEEFLVWFILRPCQHDHGRFTASGLPWCMVIEVDVTWLQWTCHWASLAWSPSQDWRGFSYRRQVLCITHINHLQTICGEFKGTLCRGKTGSPILNIETSTIAAHFPSLNILCSVGKCFTYLIYMLKNR